MNNSLSKYKIVTNKLNFFTLNLFVFALPFKDSYLPTILVLWIFTWLLEGNLKQKFYVFQYKNSLFMALAFYFLLYITALFQTNNLQEGIKYIQQILSIIFFPLIISGSNKVIKKNYKIILWVFVVGTLVSSLYIIFHALYVNMHFESGTWTIKISPWKGISEKYSFFQTINMRLSYFSGSLLTQYIHPSYFSMYSLFSIIILIDFLRKKIIHKDLHKILTIFIITFFVFMVYLLQSRAGFIAFIVSSFFIILFEIYRKKQKRYFFVGIITLSIGVTFILFSTRMQTILKQTDSILKEPDKVELKKMDARFQTNFAAFQIIKENFWFGVGPANMYDELKKQYKKYGFEKAAEERLNAHNQYMETFAGLGIFGFLALMYILIGGFVYAYRNKHYLLFFLLLILSINFLFESMMNRMNGILFMMLFYSLFVFMKREDDKLPEN